MADQKILAALCSVIHTPHASGMPTKAQNNRAGASNPPLPMPNEPVGVAIAVFVLLPITPLSCMLFGAAIGVLWLSTVPPTSGLVMLMFGTRYMAMLYGFAFFSHQVGGFLGVWLGGAIYEATGSYSIVWWLSVALSFASAVINLPIKERPVNRSLIRAA